MITSILIAVIVTLFPASDATSIPFPDSGRQGVEVPALPLPEWATDFPTSPSGAPVIDHGPWEVFYADGYVLWESEDGALYWDHPTTHNI